MTKNGPERLLMPGYMKDVFGFYDNPLREAKNKQTKALAMAEETATIAGGEGGKDWRGDPILSPPAEGASWLSNVPSWLKQYFGYVIQNAMPIAAQNVMKGEQPGSNISGVESALGVRTAPYMLETGHSYDPNQPHSFQQARRMQIQRMQQQGRQSNVPAWMRYGNTLR
jgi:hypothetical protein